MFTSQYKIQANYVMLLEKELFNELIFMDYLDTYEFKNTTLQLDKRKMLLLYKLEDLIECELLWMWHLKIIFDFRQK